jgi:hypothetical protein
MKFTKHVTSLFLVMTLMMTVFVLPTAAAPVDAAPTTSTVLVNGTETSFEAYLIGGNNYFKLRDIAYALSGTEKQFQATYDALTKQVVLTSRTAYAPVGGEMSITGKSESLPAVPTVCEFYLDGAERSMAAYLINEANYIKLRDIAAAFDFGVTYIGESNTIAIDTSAGYTPDKASTDAPSDLNVTFIGDSIGVGITPYLQKFYPNLTVDAKVSRQFSEAKSIVSSLLQSGKLGPTVVIQLGSNGTIRESDMRKVIELIGSDRKIVFVNVQVPRTWCEGDNKVISKVCLDYTNTIIADWYGASINNSGYFYKDGVHPNKTGATAMAQLIADAILKIQYS